MNTSAAVHGAKLMKIKLNKNMPAATWPQSVSTSDGSLPMRSQIATASKRNVRHRPYAFTEHGAIMAASVLNTPGAIDLSRRLQSKVDAIKKLLEQTVDELDALLPAILDRAFKGEL